MLKKKHVGRPSNLELKKNKRNKILICGIIVMFIGFIITLLCGKFNKLMGNSVIVFECDDGKPIQKNGKMVCQVSKNAILVGDVDLNGKITNDDIILMEKAFLNSTELDKYQFAAADINQNGTVESIDIELLTKYLNGEDVVSTYKTYNLGTLKTCAVGYLSGSKCIMYVDAKKIEKNKILYGDVNSDGKVNELDIEYLIKSLANFSEYKLKNSENADVNSDGKVNAEDVYILIRYLNKNSAIKNLPYKNKIAQESKISNALYGDINLDGKVDELDLVYLTKYLTNSLNYNLTSQSIINADLNGDDKVDIKDRVVLSKYLGKEENKTFTLKYDSNGGTGKMNNQHIQFGINTKLNKNNYTKKGYNFIGWKAYNNSSRQFACYKNRNKTSQGYVSEDICRKYGYVYYKDQQVVFKTGNIGEVITMYAQWVNMKKAVTVKFTPETNSTIVYSRRKYKIKINMNLSDFNNNYYYKWITYKNGKLHYNGNCSKASSKNMINTLDIMAKRYGEIAIYSDSSCHSKITSYKTNTYNLNSVIWPVTPQFQLLEHDKMINRYKHYAYGISEGHEGLDITIPVGTPVYAIANGTICSTYVGNGINNDEDFGNALIQTTKINGKSYRIIYAHLKKFVVKKGNVAKGQIIAYSGMTGGTRIPHVHVDIRNTNSCSINIGSRINPLRILPSISNFNNLKSSVSRKEYTKSEFPDSSIDLYNRMSKAQKNGNVWNYKIYGKLKKNYKINRSLTLKKGTIVELISRARYRRYRLKIKYNNKIYSNLDETYFQFVWNN